MPSGNEAPFWARGRLGGEESMLYDQQTLRGYGSDRYNDNNLSVLNFELRTRVFELTIMNTRGVLELAPFVEAGRVFHDMSGDPVAALHPVGGIGFRGIAEPFVVASSILGWAVKGRPFLPASIIRSDRGLRLAQILPCFPTYAHNSFARRDNRAGRALIRPFIHQRAKLDMFFMKQFRANSLSTWFLRALRHQHHQRYGPEGNYYEFGVGKGRSMSRFLRALKVFCDAEDLDPYRYSLFVFDSFEGMPPKSSPRDEHPRFREGCSASASRKPRRG